MALSNEKKKSLEAKVTFQFNATPEQLFQAWIEPQMVSHWMTASGGTMLRTEIDARLGGTFAFVVRRQGEDIAHIGEYFEFEKPHRLGFTWSVPQDSSDISRVFIEITSKKAGSSELTLVHEMHPNWELYIERTSEAWKKMLQKIADHLK
jgi:uncharacterized protein YndB with AHSA1/START domain